jgi:hypothetical protein
MTDRSKLEATVWKKFPGTHKVHASTGDLLITDANKLRALASFSVAELFNVLARLTLPSAALESA